MRRNPLIALARTPLVAAIAAVVGAACSDGPDEVALVEAPLCDGVEPLVGIDVSHWQGDIDWAKVKGAGIKYAFIRVSDGIGTPDTKFDRNWTKAKDNGIPRGIYQFFRPGRDAVAQADIVIEALDRLGMGELPPVIDVEYQKDANGVVMTPAAIAAQVGKWIDRVEGVLGVRPIIYTGRYFWNDYVKTTAYNTYPLWIAHYTTAACPNLPAAWSDWTFWQYTSSGTVNGISGGVDTNRFKGTMQDLLTLVPDERCRLTPAWKGCDANAVARCVDGQVEASACGAGTTCGGADPHCIDDRCTRGAGGEDGVFCADSARVATCTRGVYAVSACGAGSSCQDGACEEDPGPVDTGPGEVEVVEAVEVVEVVEPGDTAEPVPDAIDAGPESDGAARAGIAARTVRATTSVEPGGCAAGGGSAGALALGLMTALLVARRAGLRRDAGRGARA